MGYAASVSFAGSGMAVDASGWMKNTQVSRPALRATMSASTAVAKFQPGVRRRMKPNTATPTSA